MALKPPRSAPFIPPGSPVIDENDPLSGMIPPGGMSEQADSLPEPSEEEEVQIDRVLGAITDDIYDTRYDEIVDILKKGENDLPKAVGTLGAEMLFEEVMAAMEQGMEISNSIKLGLAAEINLELAEVAANEKLIDFKSDEHAQKFQGEALVYGLERYGELGDPNIDPEESMDLAQSILSGEQPEGIVAPKRGYREDIAPESAMPSPTPAVGVT
jgi:hypothetical protein|tara:strand:- start:96 stop:737 length:642 start_codon:yes stop_codon:yes gene_type:complete